MTRRAGKIAIVFAAGPAVLVVAGLGGVGGAWLALHLMFLAAGNFFIGPLLWLGLAMGGFVIGSAVTLAIIVLLGLPIAHRSGWGRDAGNA